MTWNSAPGESIETIRQDFLSLLEKIQKEARKQSGITVEDGSETLTVEQFTEMMERNLESIKKSNHVTREGYDAMATRVKRINAALGLVAGLAGAATGAVVGGGVAGGSNVSLRTFLGCIKEKRQSILDALDALWRNSEQKIADSNAQPASWMSKVYKWMHRFQKRIFGDSSQAKLEIVISKAMKMDSSGVENTIKEVYGGFDCYETYKRTRDAYLELFSDSLIAPQIGICLVVVFSASLSIGVATAAYRVLSLKNKYLEEELEQLKADNHMESIAKTFRDLLGAFEEFFLVGAEESINVDILNSKWEVLVDAIRSSRQQIKLVTKIWKARIGFAQKQGKGCNTGVHVCRWLGAGAIFVGSAVLTGGASAIIAIPALEAATVASSVSLAVAIGAGAATTGGGIASLCASTEFAKCEAGFKIAALSWQEKLDHLNYCSEFILIPVEDIFNRLERVRTAKLHE